MASARGVALKQKEINPNGNMIVFSAASGDETAYPFPEMEHGLFTYFLLKKLKQTKGNVSLGDLQQYITDNVAKESIVSNGRLQTPTVSASPVLGDKWKMIKLNKC